MRKTLLKLDVMKYPRQYPIVTECSDPSALARSSLVVKLGPYIIGSSGRRDMDR